MQDFTILEDGTVDENIIAVDHEGQRDHDEIDTGARDFDSELVSSGVGNHEIIGTGEPNTSGSPLVEKACYRTEDWAADFVVFEQRSV